MELLTISEAADAKGVSRNAIWLLIRSRRLNARLTSGGIFLIEEDEKWDHYRPRPYPRKTPLMLIERQ